MLLRVLAMIGLIVLLSGLALVLGLWRPVYTALHCSSDFPCSWRDYDTPAKVEAVLERIETGDWDEAADEVFQAQYAQIPDFIHERALVAYLNRDGAECQVWAYRFRYGETLSVYPQPLLDALYLEGCTGLERWDLFWEVLKDGNAEVGVLYLMAVDIHEQMSQEIDSSLYTDRRDQFQIENASDSLTGIIISFAASEGNWSYARALLDEKRQELSAGRWQRFEELSAIVDFGLGRHEESGSAYADMEAQEWSALYVLDEIVRPQPGSLTSQFVSENLEMHDMLHGEPSFPLEAVVRARLGWLASEVNLTPCSELEPHLHDLDVMLTYRLSEFEEWPDGAVVLSSFSAGWIPEAYRQTLQDRCAIRQALSRDDALEDCTRAEAMPLELPLEPMGNQREAIIAHCPTLNPETRPN